MGRIEVNGHIHETAVIEGTANVAQSVSVWHHTHIMKGAVIHDNCNLGKNTFVGKNVVLNQNTKVQNNVSIYEGVQIGASVFLGPSCVFTNVINPRSSVNRKLEFKKTIIQEGVTIGANATILCGVRIGSYAFVGAAAVVVDDILDYELCVGNPARRIGWISESGERLQFDINGRAICSQDNTIYILERNQVKKITNA